MRIPPPPQHAPLSLNSQDILSPTALTILSTSLLIFTTTPSILNGLNCLLCLLCNALQNTFKQLQESIPNQPHPDMVISFLCILQDKALFALYSKVFSLQLYLSVWGCCWEVGSNQDTITRKELFWDKVMSLSLTCWLPEVDYPALSIIVMMKAILHLSFNKALRFLISSSSEILMPLVPKWQQRSGVQKELPSVLYGLYRGARIQENSCYRGNILHILTSIIPAG